METVTTILLSVRSSCQLAQLAQNIKEKAEREPLNHISSTIWHWSAVLSRFAEHVLLSLTQHADIAFKSPAVDLNLELMLKAVLKMHFARIDAIAQGGFHDLNLR